MASTVSVSKATSPIHKKQIKLIDTISQKLHQQYKQKVTLEKIRQITQSALMGKKQINDINLSQIQRAVKAETLVDQKKTLTTDRLNTRDDRKIVINVGSAYKTIKGKSNTVFHSRTNSQVAMPESEYVSNIAPELQKPKFLRKNCNYATGRGLSSDLGSARPAKMLKSKPAEFQNEAYNDNYKQYLDNYASPEATQRSLQRKYVISPQGRVSSQGRKPAAHGAAFPQRSSSVTASKPMMPLQDATASNIILKTQASDRLEHFDVQADKLQPSRRQLQKIQNAYDKRKYLKTPQIAPSHSIKTYTNGRTVSLWDSIHNERVKEENNEADRRRRHKEELLRQAQRTNQIMVMQKQTNSQTEKNHQIQSEKRDINTHVYHTNCLEWEEFNQLKKKQRELSQSYDQNLRFAMAQQKKRKTQIQTDLVKQNNSTNQYLEDVRQDQENKRMQQNLLCNIYRSQHSEMENTKKEMKSFDDRATKAHFEKEHQGFQLNANAYEDKMSKNVKFQEQILDKSLSPDTKLKNYSMFLKIKDGVQQFHIDNATYQLKKQADIDYHNDRLKRKTDALGLQDSIRSQIEATTQQNWMRKENVLAEEKHFISAEIHYKHDKDRLDKQKKKKSQKQYKTDLQRQTVENFHSRHYENPSDRQFVTSSAYKTGSRFGNRTNSTLAQYREPVSLFN